MKSYISDAELCLNNVARNLARLCATHVDDTIHLGRTTCCKLWKLKEETVKRKERKWETVHLTGVQIRKNMH